MGQAAMSSRCDRFVKEFHNDFVSDCPLRVGQTLTVRSVGIGQGYGQQVKLAVLFVDENGEEHELEFESVLYDPEAPGEEVVEALLHYLDLSRQEALRRLKKADLLDDD